MKAPSEKEMAAVLRLDGPARFAHFIKRVVDFQVAWGLWKEGGWVLMENNNGARLLPLWPARDYAELCRVEDWTSYAVTEITLDDLLAVLLPKLEEKGVLAAVFPTPTGQGVPLPVRELEAALRRGLEKYE